MSCSTTPSLPGMDSDRSLLEDPCSGLLQDRTVQDCLRTGSMLSFRRWYWDTYAPQVRAAQQLTEANIKLLRGAPQNVYARACCDEQERRQGGTLNLPLRGANFVPRLTPLPPPDLDAYISRHGMFLVCGTCKQIYFDTCVCSVQTNQTGYRTGYIFRYPVRYLCKPGQTVEFWGS